MLLLRLVTTALCAACLVLLITFKPVRIVVTRPAVTPLAQAAQLSGSRPFTPCARSIARGALHDSVARGSPRGVTVIDVAATVATSDLLHMLRLRAGEHVAAVNDQPVEDAPASWLIAQLDPRAGDFVDLTISSAWTERRVLVLLH